MVSLKRSPSATPDPLDNDLSPPITPTPKKSKASAKKASPKKSPAKTASGNSGSDEGKKTGAWTGQEIKMLYKLMCPKQSGVNWGTISASIPGRDIKSCQNKWARVQSKIDKAIEELGE